MKRHTRRNNTIILASILFIGLLSGIVSHWGISCINNNKSKYQLGELISGLQKANVQFNVVQDPRLRETNTLILVFNPAIPFRGHKITGILLQLDVQSKDFLITTPGKDYRATNSIAYDSKITVSEFLLDVNNPLWQSWAKTELPSIPAAVK